MFSGFLAFHWNQTFGFSGTLLETPFWYSTRTRFFGFSGFLHGTLLKPGFRFSTGTRFSGMFGGWVTFLVFDSVTCGPHVLCVPFASLCFMCFTVFPEFLAFLLLCLLYSPQCFLCFTVFPIFLVFLVFDCVPCVLLVFHCVSCVLCI